MPATKRTNNGTGTGTAAAAAAIGTGEKNIKKKKKKSIEKPRSTNISAPPSDIKLVRSPVGIFSRVYKYFNPTVSVSESEPDPEPDPEPEVLPEPHKCYSSIYENEYSFREFIKLFGIDKYISKLTGGNCVNWSGLKISGKFEKYDVKSDNSDQIGSIFELYKACHPYSIGFDKAYYQHLKTQCHDKFFSISSDSENKFCPLRYGSFFIYKLIYNTETKVYTLHFFGDCKDKGCKDVACMGKGGWGSFEKDISVDHTYIYKETDNECVVMAGQVSIINGGARFNNSSGHYRPDPISYEIEGVIKKIMDKALFHCIIDGGGRKYKKYKKKRKNNKKTKRRKPRSKSKRKINRTKKKRKIR
jgi:hypothetical protein